MIEFVGNTLIILGIIFILLGSIFVLILPNFYARLLACSQIDTIGLITSILGIFLISFKNATGLKVLLILLFAVLINPISSYAIGRSAFLRGETPDNKEERNE